MTTTDKPADSGPSVNTERLEDRRKYSRSGLFSFLEDITYAVLRGSQSQSTTAQVAGMGVHMNNKLSIVARNACALRIPNARQTWLVYHSDGTVRAMDVDHGHDGAPFVVARFDRSA